MNNNLEQDDQQVQDSNPHKSHVRIDKGLLGEEFITVFSPKDRHHGTYDSEKFIKRTRLSARISGIVTEAGLLTTGSTFVTSILGRFIVNKAMQDWRIALFVAFVLLIFPFFLYLYTSSKVADVKWSFILKILSISFGGAIGGSYA
ncbi:MAG: hypothetical protein AUK48_00390 [Oscillatoriales cyanobacterium CG2_30_44_21]|nr:MAG: hypothetical protein AUK48_00390 [Oscillatoriales cyanobacterium CG2_30_44_21]